MPFGIESGDFYKAGLLVLLASGIFLVGYMLDFKNDDAQRVRVALRTAIHLPLILVAEHYIREAGFTQTGLAILVVVIAISIVLGRVFPKEEEPDEPYFERLPHPGPNLEPPDFAGRVYQPGISPFA